MTQTTTVPELVLERTLDAPIQRVFDAWTNPELLAKWFAPGPMTCRVEGMDARVGGTYRMTMVGPEGEYTCIGKFTAIKAPNHLAFTFNWAGADAAMPQDTLCTVDLKELNGKTHLRFVHAGFPNAEARTNHEEGWVGCLEKLPHALA